MNDDFGFSKWAVLFPVLSLTVFAVATVMIFTAPEGVPVSANDRLILFVMVAFLGLSALIQGNALFQIERRLKDLGPPAALLNEDAENGEEENGDEDWQGEDDESAQDAEEDEVAETAPEADSEDDAKKSDQA